MSMLGGYSDRGVVSLPGGRWVQEITPEVESRQARLRAEAAVERRRREGDAYVARREAARAAGRVKRDKVEVPPMCFGKLLRDLFRGC